MIACISRDRVKRVLIASAIALLLSFTVSALLPAVAQASNLTVRIPFDGDRDHQAFLRDAEAMATQRIDREFRQNSTLNTLEVTVLGERNGEIIPIFSVSVSRDQWQTTPLVSSWAEYYSASYALLRRHQDVRVIATAASDAPTAPRSRSFASEAAIQRAADAGRLTGRQAQVFMDDLD